jgi:putative transposase
VVWSKDFHEWGAHLILGNMWLISHACGMSHDESLPVRRRLWHNVPHWVDEGAWFFITVNCFDRTREQLTLPTVSAALFDAARFYHDTGKWHIGMMLLMPDHWHALMSFPRGGKPMAELLRDWKRYTCRKLGVEWQDGFFDHRLRSVDEVDAKFEYIRRNPVVKGLCKQPDEWAHQMRCINGEWVIGNMVG